MQWYNGQRRGIVAAQAILRRRIQQAIYNEWYSEQRQSLIKAQALARMWLARRRYLRWHTTQRNGVIALQAIARTRQERKRYLAWHDGVGRRGIVAAQALARRRQPQGDISVNVRRLLPKPGPKMAMGVVWWAFGLYALFMARAPYTPTAAEEGLYSELMQQAVFSPEAREAQQEFMHRQAELDKVHVFGWRWRAPYDQLVPPRQRDLEDARRRFDAALRERDALQSEAKAAVGLFSQYGVDEARDRFWKAYQSGKDFAKRMTFWDVMFGLPSRDEEFYVTILRWLGQIMMNFTIGLLSALFSFGMSLVSMIWEYKAGYLSGLLFFLVAMSGASAMVATFIGGMYGTAVGGVLAIAQSAQNNARLRGNEQHRRPQMRHVPQRAHYAHYD